MPDEEGVPAWKFWLAFLLGLVVLLALFKGFATPESARRSDHVPHKTRTHKAREKTRR